MIKLLFKWVVPLAIVLTVFIVGYNYYWGTADEKVQSQQIIAKFRDLGKDVIGLLKSEKGKYETGKYDEVMSKISAGIATLKENASSASGKVGNWSEQIKDLEQKKAALESQIASLDNGTLADDSNNPPGQRGYSQSGTGMPAFSIEQLNSQIEALATQTQELGMSLGK